MALKAKTTGANRTRKARAAPTVRGVKDILDGLIGEFVEAVAPARLHEDPWFTADREHAQLELAVLDQVVSLIRSTPPAFDYPRDRADDLRKLRAVWNVLVPPGEQAWIAYTMVDEALAERRRPAFDATVKRSRELFKRLASKLASDDPDLAREQQNPKRWAGSWRAFSPASDEECWAAAAVESLTPCCSDPAFSRVPIPVAVAAFRDAAKTRRPSMKGGAANKGAWTVLAKLTLASGALDAEKSTAAHPKSEEVAREAKRLRSLADRWVTPAQRSDHTISMLERAVELETGCQPGTAQFQRESRELRRAGQSSDALETYFKLEALDRSGADDETYFAALKAAHARLF